MAGLLSASNLCLCVLAKSFPRIILRKVYPPFNFALRCTLVFMMCIFKKTNYQCWQESTVRHKARERIFSGLVNGQILNLLSVRNVSQADPHKCIYIIVDAQQFGVFKCDWPCVK